MATDRSKCWRRPALLAAALLPLAGLGPTAAAGLNATAAQRAMEGTWIGDKTRFVVDTTRLQVNTDPDKPFDWRAFKLVNVTGRMVVFDIGSMRYVALFSQPGTIALTSPSFNGQRLLHLVHR